MTTTDDERCCRIYLMLFNGGTKISKALFEKCMKGQTPENHIPHPWTLDHFLRANKTKILGTKTGRAEQSKIFPARGASTQVEEWDLYMYCFFLIEIIDVKCRLRMDIKQLRKIRNKICHQNEPNIEIQKYNRTVDKLEVIYERLLKEICDEELTIEVNRIFKASKEDPLSTKEIIFALHKFYKTDLETREILTQQNAETREILTQQNAELSCNVKTLMKKMDDIDKKQNLMLSCGLVDCEFENSTETCVELRIKNCPSCTERFISNALVSMYKKETGQPSNEQLSLSEETRTELMSAVKDTVASFASKKRPIIDAEQNCVILLIKCSTVNSLLSLFYDCINGDLKKEFQKLESAVRQIKGLEEVSLEAVLYMDEFYRTMQRTVSGFDESVTRAYGKYLQNRGQGQTENTYGITDVRLVERQLPEDDLSDNCNESKDEDLLSDKSEVHSSPYLSDSECKQSVEHGETGVSNQNRSLKTDPTSEAVIQLKYTTKMDQQEDNKVEEDLCVMGENILDHKQLSEEEEGSHSPLYLHSQPKVNIDSEVFTHPVSTEAVASANTIFIKGKTFNDPIHGQVELHPVCIRIIDTPQFQRLRHIKQLDTCYLVYPGASHNRFEHSIGVCHLAGKLLKTIRDSQPEEKISDKDILCVEIAGLCHDLGQGPFSRVFEKRFMPRMKRENEKKFTHENIARKMFEYMLSSENVHLKKDIQDILTGCGLSRFEEQDFTFICEMIDDPKDIEKHEWPYKGRNKDKSYMYEIVANKRNGIDVDKWDYLARDSYMLGIKVNVDYNRCFTSARVIKCNGINGRQDSSNTGNGQVYRKQICYRDKVAQDLYDMFYTRMTLHRRAYQRETHKIIGMMICDALELADAHFTIHGKKISETVDDMEAYTYLNDDVIQLIINDNNPKLEAAQDILHDIMYRRLFKCVTQTHCKDENLKEIDLKEGINKYLKGIPMEEKFLHYDIVKFNYGMENKNPLEKVRFYTKDHLDEPIKLAKDQVSFVLPDVFEECIIRLYCNTKGRGKDKIVEIITKAFGNWCREKGYPLPQDKYHQTKPKTRSSSELEGSNTQGRSDERPPKSLPEPASGRSSLEQPVSYGAEGIEVRSETSD